MEFKNLSEMNVIIAALLCCTALACIDVSEFYEFSSGLLLSIKAEVLRVKNLLNLCTKKSRQLLSDSVFNFHLYKLFFFIYTHTYLH